MPKLYRSMKDMLGSLEDPNYILSHWYTCVEVGDTKWESEERLSSDCWRVVFSGSDCGTFFQGQADLLALEEEKAAATDGDACIAYDRNPKDSIFGPDTVAVKLVDEQGAPTSLGNALLKRAHGDKLLPHFYGKFNFAEVWRMDIVDAVHNYIRESGMFFQEKDIPERVAMWLLANEDDLAPDEGATGVPYREGQMEKAFLALGYFTPAARQELVNHVVDAVEGCCFRNGLNPSFSKKRDAALALFPRCIAGVQIWKNTAALLTDEEIIRELQ